MSTPHARSRRLLIPGAVVLIALAAVGAVLAFQFNDGEGVVLAPETTYTEGVAGTWQRINPLYANLNQADEDLAQLIFAGLLRTAPDGSVEGDLADLPDVSDGGRTYTFRLREGLQWQDGVALTARDVAFTIAQIQAPGFKGDSALAASWSDVQAEVVDTRTIVFRLPQASAPFLARNATIGILPEHLLRQYTPETLFDAPFNQQPVGAGPFRLVAIDGQRAQLAAFDRYYRGRPTIDRFDFRFYPDYPSALRAAAAGEVDGLLIRDPLSEAQATDVASLKGMTASRLQRTAYVVLYLNNAQAAFFADERVRRAMSLGIDRTALSRLAFGPEGATPSSSAIPPGSWAYAKEYDTVQPDIAEAKRLLEEAGWKPHPTTGILVREGQEFRFTIRTDSDPGRIAIAQAVAGQLEPLGIRANVVSTSFAVLRRDFLQERRYDAAVSGWDQGADPDPYFGWHSSQTGTAGLNLANFANVVVDELIAKARTSTDTEVRRDQYRQFQEKWAELAPGIVLGYPRYTYIRPSSLDGFTPSVVSRGSQRFYDVQRWKP